MGKRCGNCDNGKWLNRKDAVPEICLKCEYVFGEPSNWKEKQMTNADRIRAMTDEELEPTIFAFKLGYAPWCDHHCKNEGEYGCDTCILNWLKQPAEEE